MIDRHIRFRAGLHPDAPAVILREGALSFARLDADVDRVAAALTGVGVARDGPVAVGLADPYHHWLAILALARLGVASAPAADGAGAPLPLDDATLVAALAGPHVRVASAPVDREGIGRVLVSSGTTGPPKRVGMRWGTIDAAIRHALTSYGGGGPGPWIAATGAATILGFTNVLAAWAGGHPAVLGLARAPDAALIGRLRPALIAMIPAQLRDLVASAAAPLDPGLRLLVGGGPVPPALARAVRERLGCRLLGIYGASETGGVALAEGALLESRPHVAGHILPDVTVEITDESGVPLPVGALGHVRVRGPRVASGYCDSGVGADRFRDGWFWPGDLGRLEPDGLLLIEGRADEILNIGGEKLLPDWIEQAVLACPGVVDAGAVALADAAGLDRCALGVVRGPGFSEARLSEALRPALLRIGAVDWYGLDAVPRNAMGKIDRPALAAALAKVRAARGP